MGDSMKSDMGPAPHGKVAAVGIAWIRKEDYAAVRAIMIDGHNLPETYEKWRYTADKTAAKMAAQGHQVIRAIIDPTEFPIWCQSKGLNIDANGRTAFGAEQAARAMGLMR
jgi:hypothetical protein